MKKSEREELMKDIERHIRKVCREKKLENPLTKKYIRKLMRQHQISLQSGG